MDNFFYFGQRSSTFVATSENEPLTVEFSRKQPGESTEQRLSLTQFIIVIEGSFEISYDHFFNREVKAGQILLLAPGCHFTAKTSLGFSAFIFRQKDHLRFSDEFTFDDREDSEDNSHQDLHTLNMVREIALFLSLMKENMENGLMNEDYFYVKNRELLFLMNTYYGKDELSSFFYPLLSPDARFTEFVLQHYRDVKTVRELAKLYDCSISCFDKKFRKAFGTSTYQWMQQKKVNLLYHEINATDKPIKQIAEEQMFLSLPQFNDYCKKHFGYPPGKMRQLALLFKENDPKDKEEVEIM